MLPTSEPVPIGRQQSMKSAHRRAIAMAAVDLAQRFGPGNFSADQLAERAAVARRTIFNHFRSIDDAIYAGLSQILEPAVESLAQALSASTNKPPAHETALGSAFDDLSAALLRVDLVQPLCQIVRTIASREADHPQTNQWVGTVLGSVTPLLESAAAVRAPASPPGSRALLVRALLAALFVAFDDWYSQTDAVDDAHSRVAWRTALEASFTLLRTGFGPNSA